MKNPQPQISSDKHLLLEKKNVQSQNLLFNFICMQNQNFLCKISLVNFIISRNSFIEKKFQRISLEKNISIHSQFLKAIVEEKIRRILLRRKF